MTNRFSSVEPTPFEIGSVILLPGFLTTFMYKFESAASDVGSASTLRNIPLTVLPVWHSVMLASTGESTVLMSSITVFPPAIGTANCWSVTCFIRFTGRRDWPLLRKRDLNTITRWRRCLVNKTTGYASCCESMSNSSTNRLTSRKSTVEFIEGFAFQSIISSKSLNKGASDLWDNLTVENQGLLFLFICIGLRRCLLITFEVFIYLFL